MFHKGNPSYDISLIVPWFCVIWRIRYHSFECSFIHWGIDFTWIKFNYHHSFKVVLWVCCFVQWIKESLVPPLLIAWNLIITSINWVTPFFTVEVCSQLTLTVLLYTSIHNLLLKVVLSMEWEKKPGRFWKKREYCLFLALPWTTKNHGTKRYNIHTLCYIY